jgi:hypothetical protein
MRRTLAIAATLAFALAASSASAAPNCKVGKPCGNSCISKDKVCHIPGTASAGPVHTYKLDKTGKKCLDEKNHYAKKELCHA